MSESLVTYYLCSSLKNSLCLLHFQRLNSQCSLLSCLLLELNRRQANDQLGLNIYCSKDIYLYINFILNDFD